MIEMPPALQSKFEEHLQDKAIPDNLHGMYQKRASLLSGFLQKISCPVEIRKEPAPSGPAGVSKNSHGDEMPGLLASNNVCCN